MSTPKKVLFIGLGILGLGIVLLGLGIQRSPAFWQGFQCGYDLSLNNSSLTRDQISEYCNNQTLKIENVEDVTTLGFGSILIVIGLIITGISGGIWFIARRRERTEAPSSAGLSSEMMIDNRGKDGKEEDHLFTPKKVLAYCIIVGLTSGTLSIFINSLTLLSVAAFVFSSITVWYLLGEKFHRWKERRRKDRHLQ